MAREPESVKTDARSWLYSLLLHGIVLALLLIGVGFGVHRMRAAPGTGKDTQPVQAKVVSEALINQEAARLKAAADKKKAAEAAAAKKRQQEIEAARKAREAEQARLAKLKAEREAAQKAAAEQKAQRQQQAKAEQQRLAKLQAQREAEEKQLAAAQAKAAEQKRKAAAAEAARKKAAEEARQRKEAAAKAEAARQAELKKELAAEQKQREQAAKAAKEAVAHSRSLGLYSAAIEQKVQRNWIRPASVQPGLNCVVEVTQIPGGEVVNATMKSCNGDEAVKQSILSAVYRASPLPRPSDPSLFERQIEFTFAPEDLNGNGQ